jgi:hypothetical protein
VSSGGYNSTGPHLLHQAPAHAVDGSVAPATDGRFIDEPSSFYGWLTRQHKTGYKAVHSAALRRAQVQTKAGGTAKVVTHGHGRAGG